MKGFNLKFKSSAVGWGKTPVGEEDKVEEQELLQGQENEHEQEEN